VRDDHAPKDAPGRLAGNRRALSIGGLSKSYGVQRAVDDVSFEVPAGSLLTLLGPSGCGKTTILRAIAGFVAPDAGRIEVGRLAARIGAEILGRSKLLRVDENRRDYLIALGPGGSDERHMPLMQCAHRRH